MLLIGDVAGRTGLTVSAIRYYEACGLVAPVRRASGRRVFDDGAVARLRVVSAARRAGFSLQEIGRLLDSRGDGSGEWRSVVEAKIDATEVRIEALRDVARALRDSLACRCRAWDDCPVVTS